MPGGILVAGEKYRWNMQAHSPGGWSAVSNTLYFQAPTPTVSYTLSVNLQGQGTASLSPSGGTYVSGTQVTLTATPASGWQFSGWGGDLSGSQNPATITMTSNKSVTVLFTQQSSPSAPTALSPGSSSEGTVISTLTPTLQWSSVSGADYYAVAISQYPYGSSYIIYNPQQVYGTSITVPGGTLSAGVKYRWNMQAHGPGGWSAVSNTLYFQAPTPALNYTLTVNLQGQGMVSLSPSGGTYVSGTQVTLTATPASGWQFSDWSGDLTGSQNPATVTINSNKSITATFAQQQAPPPAPTITSAGSGSEPGMGA